MVGGSPIQRGCCSLQGWQGKDGSDDMCLPSPLWTKDNGQWSIRVLRQAEDPGPEGGDHSIPEEVRGLLQHPHHQQSPVQSCQDVSDQHCHWSSPQSWPGQTRRIHSGNWQDTHRLSKIEESRLSICCLLDLIAASVDQLHLLFNFNLQ